MNVDIFMQMAAEVACSKDDRRQYRLGAIGIRRDGVIVRACNGPTPCPEASVHAEARLAKKLDRGAIVCVVRVNRKTGQFQMAKPCPNCERILRSCHVKKVFYTTNDGIDCLHM